MRVVSESTITSCNFGGNSLLSVYTERDLRIIISSSSETSSQAVEACVATRGTLGATSRPFRSSPKVAFNSPYAPPVRPGLEYGGGCGNGMKLPSR